MWTETLSGCCAITEIQELREHDTPENAMDTFVQDQLDEVGNFVIFSGVERFTNNDDKNPPRRADYSSDDSYHYAMREWQTGIKKGYASAFAAYIKKHKLGTLATLKAKTNMVNEPTHVVKVYLWSPDHKALRQWRKARA